MDELTMTMQLSEKSMMFAKHMAEIINYIITESQFRKQNREVAEALMMITKNGTVAPYLQAFGKEHSRFADLLKREIEKYNQSVPKEERIIYWASRNGDGRQVIWADEENMKKITELKNMLAIGKGEYFTEITPVELMKGHEGKDVFVFSGLTQDEINILKSKPLPSGNDYSFAVKPREDGLFDVMIRDKNLLSRNPNKEDFLYNMIRTKAVLHSPVGYQIKDELEYDRQLKNRMFHYEKEEPTYLTSSTDGGKYMKITKEGFTLYEVGTNINDIRQHVLVSMNKGDKEYGKELFRAMRSINRPVEINTQVYKEHEKDLLKVLGKDAEKLSMDHRICGVLATEYGKLKLPLVASEDMKDQSDMVKAFEIASRKTAIAMVAAKTTLVLNKEKSDFSPEAVRTALESKDMKREMRELFFKEHFAYLNPKVRDEFLKQIKETPLYQELQAAAITPETKEEIQGIIENSYQDFLKEVEPEVRNEVEQAYIAYEKEVKELAGQCIENKYTPKMAADIDAIRRTEKDKCLEIVLANCVTGRPIEGVRPIQTSIAEIKAAETYDMLASAFANEIRKEIRKKIKEVELVTGKPEKIDANYLSSDEFKKLVDDIAQKLDYLKEHDKLADRSEEWHAVALKCNEDGILEEKSFASLAEDVKKIAEYDMETVVVTRSEIERETNAVMDQSGDKTGYWSTLDYEHDEETLNNVLKEDIRNASTDIDIEGQVHDYSENDLEKQGFDKNGNGKDDRDEETEERVL